VLALLRKVPAKVPLPVVLVVEPVEPVVVAVEGVVVVVAPLGIIGGGEE
jgi:hypothetical protein